MRSSTILLFLLFLTINLSAQDESLPYLRYPALSPDGQTICFSCKGDLWLVPVEGGEAKRLTVHPSDDILPQFSPDGKQILFSSRRHSNYDLYTIPVTGGEPEKLTHYTGSDYATGWTPDGDTVIFYSFRDMGYDVYKMSLNGETPVSLTGGYYDYEYNGKITPDGKKLVFNNGSGYRRWWKKNLAGNRNSDIFIRDLSASGIAVERITTKDKHDIWPVYSQEKNVIYFVANRDSISNIWKHNLSTGQQSQITYFVDDGVQWLNSDPQMEKLVFEQGFKIWYFDPIHAAPQKVNITIKSDFKENPSHHHTYKGNIGEYNISPDGKLAAMIIRGEVFVIPTDEPEIARSLTNTPQREKHPVFGSDSRTVYYSSDRNGNYDIYAYDLKNKIEKQITAASDNETKPICSPDGKKLAYYRSIGKIILYDLEEEKEVDSVEGMFIDLAVEPTIEHIRNGF